MSGLVIHATMTAKPGREEEAAAFLRETSALVGQEPGTTSFIALRTGHADFTTVAVMTGEDALAAHVGGPVPPLVRSRGAELFLGPPCISKATLVAQAHSSGVRT